MSTSKSPRVAVITSNYWPERTGIGQIATEFAEFLAGHKIDVRVVTAMPYYPEWSIYPSYSGKLWSVEQRNDVVIYRAAHFASPKPSTLGRVLHEASLCLFSLPNILRALRDTKVAFVISPDLSHAFLACMLARAFRTQLILYVQDVMPDAAVDTGLLRNKVAIAAAKGMARAIYRAADRVYTLSPGMKRRITQLAGSTRSIEIVPNTIDAQELRPQAGSGTPFRDSFVSKGVFAVVHSGNMGEKQDLGLLLRTARRLLNDPSIHFYVFGDGAVKKEFLTTKEEWKLHNISHFPLQERRMLPHILNEADLCLVSQAQSIVDVVVPSKLITSMGAAAMIVAACHHESETAILLRASRGGLIIPSGDDEALAKTITDARDGLYDTDAFRENARSYACNYFDRALVYLPIVHAVMAG
jgi:colanic acid biosynthesis glycosyl transferase WcaI